MVPLPPNKKHTIGHAAARFSICHCLLSLSLDWMGPEKALCAPEMAFILGSSDTQKNSNRSRDSSHPRNTTCTIAMVLLQCMVTCEKPVHMQHCNKYGAPKVSIPVGFQLLNQHSSWDSGTCELVMSISCAESPFEPQYQT